MAMLNDRMVYIYIIVYAHVIYITSSSRKIDTHHCCCNLKHQESIAIPSTYTKIRHVSPGKNWVDVGGNSYSFGVPSLSSLGYPFSRIVHLRCQRPRRFETVGLVGLGLSVLSIPGIQPSIWWKLLRAHFVFWGYHQEISRKFHGIFLAFLFTFFWYFGAAPNWSTTKKNGVDTTAVSKIPNGFTTWLYHPVGPVHGDVILSTSKKCGYISWLMD